ncbi:MAG: glucokinase, partial [Burkholderiales bacterium]
MAARNTLHDLVLAGDIGGTKTLLQIGVLGQDRYTVLRERRFDSRAYRGLQPMVRAFIGNRHAILAACFGVAGPVAGNCAKITNLPWEVDARSIGRALATQRVRLINDFAAVAYGIDALEKNDVYALQKGKPVVDGQRAIVGAGTGLGVGFMTWHDDHYEVISSEGGHVDFAPTDKQQIELLEFLSRRLGRVRYEDVLSGTGLVNIYEFLKHKTAAKKSAKLRNRVAGGDVAAAIAAASHDDPLAAQAMRIFTAIYGACAGNLALLGLAHGGVY